MKTYALILSTALGITAFATDWNCGSAAIDSTTMKYKEYSIITQETLANGHVVTSQSPLVAVNEATDNFLDSLKGGENICIKASPALLGGTHYLAFDAELQH